MVQIPPTHQKILCDPKFRNRILVQISLLYSKRKSEPFISNLSLTMLVYSKRPRISFGQDNSRLSN
jgi:hypothetical protein